MISASWQQSVGNKPVPSVVGPGLAARFGKNPPENDTEPCRACQSRSASPEGDVLDNLRLDKEGLGCFHVNACPARWPSGCLGSFENRSYSLFPKEGIYREMHRLTTSGLKVEIFAGNS